MSQKTYKNFLEAGSFKALKNVADVARQVILGEDQEKLEIQELVNIINSAKYVSEEKKEIIITELSAALLGRAADKADKKGKAGQAYRLERGESDAANREQIAKNRAREAEKKKEEQEVEKRKKERERNK